jgi:hypothetical protein
MSFGNRPFDSSGPQPFWQQVLLVVLPAFVGACLPPMIAHALESQKQPPPQPVKNTTSGSTKRGEKKKTRETPPNAD